ncbi:MAG: SAM-dependent methyltransferase [Solirubrobacterales bacterium]|jgi:SAM-dependent methyltransferase|nr:SAM-dependent methyltransferase [Solirubrobacterales bacterium]
MPEPRPPSAWIARFAPLAPAGSPVLDLACGSGRHTRLFLARDHPVTAIDRDLSGLEDVAGQRGLELVQADLEDGSPWPLADRRFGAVVVVNYLWRPLLARIVDAVDDNGVLLYETFALGNETFGRPTNPDFLLLPGELLEMVRGRLQIVAYEHGYLKQLPAIKQRICAVRTDRPVALYHHAPAAAICAVVSRSKVCSASKQPSLKSSSGMRSSSSSFTSPLASCSMKDACRSYGRTSGFSCL